MKLFYTPLFVIAALLSIPASAQISFWAEKKGPYGGSVNDIEFDVPRSMVYAIVENRFFYSTDDGTTWNKNNVTASVWDIEVGDNGSVYLTDGFAIYRSTNGIDFTKVTENFTLSGGYKIRRVTNGSGILVALASNRLYYSTDDGVTFLAGASGSFKVTSFAVGPGISGGQAVYMLDNATGLPRRSSTGGASLDTNPANTSLTGPCFSISSRNEETQVFAVNSTGVFSSSNAETWTAIKGGSIVDATIADASNFGFLEFSADGTGMYFIDNFNAKVHYKAVTGAATTWQQATAYPGGTANNIFAASAKTLNAASPGTSIALFGNILGITKTTTGTSTFVPNANAGIEAVRPKSIMSVNNGDGNLVVDTENVGLQFSSDRGQSWTRVTTIPNTVQMMTGVSDATEKNHTILVLNTTDNDTYKSTTGSSFAKLALAPDFRWIQGTAFDRLFGLGINAAANSFYYSYDAGGNWSGAITITGLPASYSINVNDANSINIYSQTTTSAVMFLQLFNNAVGTGTEYYRVTFSIGATTSITGSAVKITTIPAAYSSILPDFMSARNGRFFLFTDNTTPDQYSFSTNGGSTWTTINSPATSNGRIFVADNGYVFLTSSTQNKVWVSRDDGANFNEIALPPGSDVSISNIRDIHIDTEDFAQMVTNQNNLHSTTNPIALPANPSGMSLMGRSASSMAIAWTDNANNETYYRVERSSNAGVSYTYAGDVTSICPSPTSRGYFVDKGLSSATTYMYRVTAVNSAGTSVGSATLSNSTLAATTPTIPDGRSWSATTIGGNGYAAVTVPQTVGIRHLGGGYYDVSNVALGTFTSTYRETFYESGGQTMLAASNQDNTIRTNGQGTWNGTNTLTLKWKKCSEDKVETVTYVLTPLVANDPVPAAPTLVQALVNATNSIEVTWAGSFYEKDYIVERSPNGTTGFVQIGANVVAPTTKLVDPGPFVEGTTYHYRVRARNHNNAASPNSTVFAATYRKPQFLLSTASGLVNYNAVTLGMYAGDFNNDGKDDLFSIQNSLTNNATSLPTIFANSGNGNFNPVVPNMTVEGYFPAAVADVNNDGKLDIGLGMLDKNQFDLYFGNGDLTFTKATTTQLGDIASIDFEVVSGSWADFNKDGRLDLLLVSSTEPPNLFKQTTGGSFERVLGGELANDVDNSNIGLWADYDNDGDQDILLTHSSDKWRLYQNNGDETFTNKTIAAGLANAEGMGGPWADYNNDGRLDLFAGDAAENALYKNNGDGTFTKETVASLSTAYSTYGNVWGDFNNDGLLDLATPTIPFFSPGSTTRLFMNTTTGAVPSFQLVTSEKINDQTIGHYGGAAFDFDGNGFIDLGLPVIGIVNGELGAGTQTVYINNNTTGNWLEVKLVGVASNKLGVGARIIVEAGGKTYHREVASGSSFISQSSFTQHFGLATATSITSVVVKWPSGTVQTIQAPNINALMTITEDGGGPAPTVYFPANNATGVNTHTILEVTFDETPTPVNGKKLTITGTGDAAATYTIDMSAAAVNGMKLTFSLPGRLTGNKHYDVSVEPGAMLDQFGNPSLAITGWGFTTAAGPAISLLSPLNNATNVPANTPLEITWDKSVTPVADKKIKVVSGANTLLEVAVATTGTVTGAKYSVNAPAGGWPYLTPLTVTLEAGAFVDGSFNDTDAITVGTWMFTTTEPPDVTPPAIGDLSGLPTTTDKTALAQTFNISITDAKGVASAKIFYRSSSGGTYIENAATGPTGTNNDMWQFQIPASGFDATGVQYYFTAVDAAGNLARNPATGSRQTLIKYKGNEAQIPASLLGSGGTKDGWKVVAIPFDLGVNNGVLSVFDELSALTVKVDWRLVALKPDPAEWLDYPNQFSTVSRGIGYFINIKTPPGIVVGADLVAPNNTRSNLFKMDLKKGWNMVGNPYLEPIDWANVVAANSLTGTAAIFKKFSAGTYTNSNTLVAYEGGFVQSDVDRQVSIPFMGQTSSTGRVGEVDFGPGEWLVPITIHQGQISNTFGGIGMHSKASGSFDMLDDINGPRWFDFTEMNFSHPEHFAKSFARDIVPVANEFVWNFTIESNVNETGMLKWDSESYSVENDLYLFDIATQTPINMKENRSYSFDPTVSKSFQIYYGEKALSKISPSRVTLGLAYPNPTSNTTTIPFSIPESQNRANIRLEILDFAGRSVGTVTNGELLSGFYHAKWQASDDLSNGLYFYRLTAGEEVLTGKIVLKR